MCPAQARRRAPSLLTLSLVFGLAACSGSEAPSGEQASEVRGASASLSSVGEAYLKLAMDDDPVWATSIGHHEYDGRIWDRSPRAARALTDGLRKLKAELATVRRDRVPAAERLAYDLLTTNLAVSHRQSDACDELLPYARESSINNLGSDLDAIAANQVLKSAADVTSLVARARKMPDVVRQTEANMRDGIGRGVVLPKPIVEALLKGYKGLVALPAEQWVLVSGLSFAEGASEALRTDARREVAAVVDDVLRPAFSAYVAFLESTYLPAARASVGLAALPGGTRCYEALVAYHTDTELTADAIHELGQSELQQIQGEMVEAGFAAYGTRDLAVIMERMQSSPENFYRSKEHVIEFAKATIDRARAAMPRYFGRLPETGVDVVPMPPESSSTPNDAYYREGSRSEGRPGRYYIGTKDASTTALLSGESTAFHEAIPGHHFQLTIADELPARPEYLRSMWSTAFVEGWGLYAERLADEAGLYSSPQARFGMLGWQAVRAARLVVDTGLHAKGWSREQAVTFFMQATPMTKEEAEGQIDRYISTPGQALAYKIGQRKILELRAKAERELGPRFDIKAFHDTVLGSGTVKLQVLESLVEEHIAARRR